MPASDFPTAQQTAMGQFWVASDDPDKSVMGVVRVDGHESVLRLVQN